MYVGEAAHEFNKIDTIQTLFVEYEQCDRLLTRFEICLRQAVGEWYEHAQRD